MIIEHWAVFINNNSEKQNFIASLLQGPIPEMFSSLKHLRGALFSKLALDAFLEEEVIHDHKILTRHTSQSLRSMSSGERKKALLQYLKALNPDFLILDNPFDNLDLAAVAELKADLGKMASTTSMIQIISRERDRLAFIKTHYFLDKDQIVPKTENMGTLSNPDKLTAIPPPPSNMHYREGILIALKNISVSYDGKTILKGIDWKIKKGEFWQLKGKNGSGKTTLLSMVTGDNPKGYGQDLRLFGIKKGSGESIWDIKKKIGYFTPAMIDRFKGYHSLENMLISGLMDSIGLYIQPTEIQLRIARQWLRLIGMEEKRATYFHDLSAGQQRLIMCIRAMVKHPLLLILDEPTAGLDDRSASLFVALVNKIALESETAIIFVSHREEPGLKADLIYELVPHQEGSTGKISRS